MGGKKKERPEVESQASKFVVLVVQLVVTNSLISESASRRVVHVFHKRKFVTEEGYAARGPGNCARVQRFQPFTPYPQYSRHFWPMLRQQVCMQVVNVFGTQGPKNVRTGAAGALIIQTI